ncbi:hypothetical protein Tco_1381202, partial [Tanacetum coccineum]
MEDLEVHKMFVGLHPWVLLGDFNVTLDVAEHSVGMANKNLDMQDFLKAVNKLEIEDSSSGFHFMDQILEESKVL